MKNRRRPPLCRIASAPASALPADPVEQLVEAARRLRRRGETRKAQQMLRRACATDEWNARNFALLGAWLLEAGAVDEGRQRMLHARWLRGREGNSAIQRSIDAFLDRPRHAA
ncbi:MAG: hypothetical protein U0414_25905 [Polyangiaceae bacterium]